MNERGSPGRTRDADRSRQAILDAAEQLFANGGYDATSLQAIADRANVSRGTPGYFFGSKDALYRAVLDRIFAEELAFVGGPVDDYAHQDLAHIVGRLLDFLASRPAFVALLEREALAGGANLAGTEGHAASIREGLAMADHLLGGVAPSGPALLAIIALCWFPFAHSETYAKPLGIDVSAAEGRAQWGQFIVQLIAGPAAGE